MKDKHKHVVEWLQEYNEGWYGPREEWTDEQNDEFYRDASLLILFVDNFKFSESIRQQQDK